MKNLLTEEITLELGMVVHTLQSDPDIVRLEAREFKAITPM